MPTPWKPASSQRATNSARSGKRQPTGTRIETRMPAIDDAPAPRLSKSQNAKLAEVSGGTQGLKRQFGGGSHCLTRDGFGRCNHAVLDLRGTPIRALPARTRTESCA